MEKLSMSGLEGKSVRSTETSTTEMWRKESDRFIDFQLESNSRLNSDYGSNYR